MAQEIGQLKGRITDLQAVESASESSTAESPAKESEDPGQTIVRAPMSSDVHIWTPWQWLLVGSILLLAFAAGGYAVDWESRRRHGGFRI